MRPHAVVAGGRNRVFTPRALFADGSQGAWYDPGDMSTMFQDAAGTVPVTAAGQSVMRINDKSGLGYHMTAATAAMAPVYNIDSNGFPNLLFDGVDDRLNVAFTTSTYPVMLMGAVKATDAGGHVMSFKQSVGSYYKGLIKHTSVNAWREFDVGNGGLFAEVETVGASANPHVVTSSHTSTGIDLRVDGVSNTGPTSHTNAFGANTFLYMGGNTIGAPITGSIYQAIFLVRLLTAAELTATEKFLGTKCGIAL